jgi:hypothetical protein
MKITDFFQKGYYINLDRRTDRNELFIKEMKSYNLDIFFERVSALDSINEPDVLKRHHYCAATYYELFKKIYNEGYENVLIFEDDAAFYSNIPVINLIENTLDDLSNFSDWNLIYFGGCPLFKMEIVSKNLSKIEWVLGTHAVGYKRETIKYVLDNYTPFEDGTIDGWYGNSPILKKYITSQPILYQRPSASDLDAHGYISNETQYIHCYEQVEKIYTYNEEN